MPDRPGTLSQSCRQCGRAHDGLGAIVCDHEHGYHRPGVQPHPPLPYDTRVNCPLCNEEVLREAKRNDG